MGGRVAEPGTSIPGVFGPTPSGHHADMALNPVNIALNVVQTPFRIAQKAVGGVLGGGGPEEKTSSSKPKDLDDVTIARKVESEVFRDRRIAKSKVDINVVDGVVWLRGQARTPQLVKLAERRASSVPEVGKVENLLHLPKTPAPSRTDTPARQRKTQRSPKKPSRRREASRPAPTAEEPAAEAEPTPAELSARGEGRQPSPLGQDEKAGAPAPKAEPTPGERAASGEGPQPTPAQPKPAEPTPAELSARGEGRQPSPLGQGEPAEPPVAEAAEPTPGELAARGEERQPSPLGQGEQGNGGGSSSS